MNREANFFLVELFCLCPWSPVLAATEFLRLKTECEDEEASSPGVSGRRGVERRPNELEFHLEEADKREIPAAKCRQSSSRV